MSHNKPYSYEKGIRSLGERNQEEEDYGSLPSREDPAKMDYRNLRDAYKLLQRENTEPSAKARESIVIEEMSSPKNITPEEILITREILGEKLTAMGPINREENYSEKQETQNEMDTEDEKSYWGQAADAIELDNKAGLKRVMEGIDTQTRIEKKMVRKESIDLEHKVHQIDHRRQARKVPGERQASVKKRTQVLKKERKMAA